MIELCKIFIIQGSLVKKLWMICSLLFLMPAHGRELTTFTEIYNSISHGLPVKLFINFKGCEPKLAMPDQIVYTEAQTVTLHKHDLLFSNSPLTMNHPDYPNQAILEHVTYKITHTNELNVAMKLISLPNYTVLGETNTVCPLSTATKVFN
ncbi:MAG: hypothetical protein CK424_06695 [Legionella sp.]|nr:MAG: hypothetical protein CK424_06695 [Legionella sp.]